MTSKEEEQSFGAAIGAAVTNHLQHLVTKQDPLLVMWKSCAAQCAANRGVVRETLARARRERTSALVNTEYAVLGGKIDCLDREKVRNRLEHSNALIDMMMSAARTLDPMVALNLSHVSMGRRGKSLAHGAAPDHSAQATYCGEAGTQDMSGDFTTTVLSCQPSEHGFGSCVRELDRILARLPFPAHKDSDRVEMVGGVADLSRGAMEAMTVAIMKQVSEEDHRLQWDTLHAMRAQLGAGLDSKPESHPESTTASPPLPLF